jgi:hypothetical protein
MEYYWLKKEGNSDTCYNMEDLEDIMLGEKTVTKGQIQSVFPPYLWALHQWIQSVSDLKYSGKHIHTKHAQTFFLSLFTKQYCTMVIQSIAFTVYQVF